MNCRKMLQSDIYSVLIRKISFGYLLIYIFNSSANCLCIVTPRIHSFYLTLFQFPYSNYVSVFHSSSLRFQGIRTKGLKINSFSILCTKFFKFEPLNGNFCKIYSRSRIYLLLISYFTILYCICILWFLLYLYLKLYIVYVYIFFLFLFVEWCYFSTRFVIPMAKANCHTLFYDPESNDKPKVTDENSCYYSYGIKTLHL